MVGTIMCLALELDQVTSVMLGAVAVRLNSVTAAALLVVVATIVMQESDVHVRNLKYNWSRK